MTYYIHACLMIFIKFITKCNCFDNIFCFYNVDCIIRKSQLLYHSSYNDSQEKNWETIKKNEMIIICLIVYITCTTYVMINFCVCVSMVHAWFHILFICIAAVFDAQTLNTTEPVVTTIYIYMLIHVFKHFKVRWTVTVVLVGEQKRGDLENVGALLR